jgi:hypothetical protein
LGVLSLIEDLRREIFDPLLNREIRIDFGDGPVSITLTEVRSLVPPSKDHEGRRAWSLSFRTVPHCPHEKAIHGVMHPQLGDPDLFLAPIGPDKEGMRCEAIFHLIPDPDPVSESCQRDAVHEADHQLDSRATLTIRGCSTRMSCAVCIEAM